MKLYFPFVVLASAATPWVSLAAGDAAPSSSLRGGNGGDATASSAKRELFVSGGVTTATHRPPKAETKALRNNNSGCSHTESEVSILAFCNKGLRALMRRRERQRRGLALRSSSNNQDKQPFAVKERFYLDQDFLSTDYDIEDPSAAASTTTTSSSTAHACHKLANEPKVVEAAQGKPLVLGTRALRSDGTSEDFIMEMPLAQWHDQESCGTYDISLSVSVDDDDNETAFACWDPSGSEEPPTHLEIPECPADYKPPDHALTWFVEVRPLSPKDLPGDDLEAGVRASPPYLPEDDPFPFEGYYEDEEAEDEVDYLVGDDPLPMFEEYYEDEEAEAEYKMDYPPNWKDAHGDGCEWYADHPHHCGDSNGLAASPNEACVVCGGGAYLTGDSHGDGKALRVSYTNNNNYGVPAVRSAGRDASNKVSSSSMGTGRGEVVDISDRVSDAAFDIPTAKAAGRDASNKVSSSSMGTGRGDVVNDPSDRISDTTIDANSNILTVGSIDTNKNNRFEEDRLSSSSMGTGDRLRGGSRELFGSGGTNNIHRPPKGSDWVKVDYPGDWEDAQGNGCDWYAGHPQRCDDHNGRLGIRPRDACVVCGGGRTDWTLIGNDSPFIYGGNNPYRNSVPTEYFRGD